MQAICNHLKSTNLQSFSNIIEDFESLNRIKIATQEEGFNIFNFSITSAHRTDYITTTMSTFV